MAIPLQRTPLLVAFLLATFSVVAPAQTCESSDENIAAHLRAYDAFGPHRSGSEGDRKTTAYLQRELSRLGYEVALQDFAVPDHTRLDARVVVGDTALPLLAQPPLSAGDARAGTLAYWSYRPGNVAPALPEHAILLVDLPDARYSSYQSFPIRRLRQQLQALPRVPAAIILITNGATGEAQLLNIEPDEAFPPVYILAPRNAALLREAAGRGQRANIESFASKGELRASNVIATRAVSGRPYWIVSTPISGWGHSVGERGPGVAAFLAMAAWARCALAGVSLQFVATSGHELENLGSRHYLKALAPSPSEVELWLHIGAGWGARDYQEAGPRLLPLRHANPYRFLMASQAVYPSLSPQFQSMPGLADAYTFAQGEAGGELGEIHHQGYNAVGLFGAHYYHHVASDRLDKTDPALVLPVVHALQDTLARYRDR